MKHVRPYLKMSYDDHTIASNETGLKCEDQSLAQQHQAEETDINHIVNRYMKTGELPQRNMPPMQGDFTEAPDMQTAMNLVVEARVAFMQQPAEIRSRFENDPAKFVDFCSDEKNRDQLRQWGMWSPEANASFELEAQTAKDLAEANQRDAGRYRELENSGAVPQRHGKGDTKKGVT